MEEKKKELLSEEELKKVAGGLDPKDAYENIILLPMETDEMILKADPEEHNIFLD